jgi:DNA-binding MarR family transcriptional regulator
MTDREKVADGFGRLFLRLHRLMDRRMAAEGASLARTKLLLLLRRHGPLRAAEIAEFFGQAPRSVTEAIDALERAGMVRRDPDPNDRRGKKISITTAGQHAASATEPLRQRLVDEIFGVLDASECAELERLIGKLSAATDAQEDRSKSAPG